MSSDVPPPSFPTLDSDPEAHAAAVQRLAPNKHLIPWKRSRKHSDASSTSAKGTPSSPSFLSRPFKPTREASASTTAPQIRLMGDSVVSDLPDVEDGDNFRWAVVYENQRGITMFSIPMYSKVALLPTDPPAFTIPEAEGSKHHQPDVSLSDYLLPDGSWVWCSSRWMIDMRDSEDGSVSYDGFEYNWVFRRSKWKPEGGFVRRRRWIRLMRRKDFHPSIHSPGTPVPPSPTSPISYRDINADDVWQGDEGDWARCHSLMRSLNRDGLRLEVWRAWLGMSSDSSPEGKRPGSDGHLLTPDGRHDVEPSYSRPPLEYIESVVQKHYQELLALFVFPDSRAEWMQSLSKTVGNRLAVTGGALGVVDYVDYDSDIAVLPKDAPVLSSSSSSSSTSSR
ncbi:hypothetical protein PENSPDRAFT_730400 [Peniophora sp. CONT]|nr:hypothetical protein PENSPDRAFT_730400 [Peniophora sp. CONT]